MPYRREELFFYIMEILNKIYNIIQERAAKPQEGSYTNTMLTKGLDKILKKVGEESAETIIAAKNQSKPELIGEIADLYYHVLLMMFVKGITPDDVAGELDKRFNKGGFHGRTDKQ